MQLGAFSISLAVKDLKASRTFYEALGFMVFAGDGTHYQIMKNGSQLIGLFQGMFDKNMLTFNPGWDTDAKPVEGFTDVREIQQRLVDAGLTPVQSADGLTTGPAHLMLEDPDGNPILIDQHV